MCRRRRRPARARVHLRRSSTSQHSSSAASANLRSRPMCWSVSARSNSLSWSWWTRVAQCQYQAKVAARRGSARIASMTRSIRWLRICWRSTAIWDRVVLEQQADRLPRDVQVALRRDPVDDPIGCHPTPRACRIDPEVHLGCHGAVSQLARALFQLARTSRPGSLIGVSQRFYVETLGCPKNQVDSDKLIGTLARRGHAPDRRPDGGRPGGRQHLRVHRGRSQGVDRHDPRSRRAAPRRAPRLVVTGCMAERYGAELAEALPEVDQVAGFGVPVALAPVADPTGGQLGAAARTRPAQPAATALELAVGVREDRRGLRPVVRVLRHPELPWPAAQPSTSIDPRPRSTSSTPARSCSSPRTSRRTARTDPTSSAPARSCRSVKAVAARVDWVRLLYLYPSDLTDELIDAICATGVPYFDLSLQHVSKPLLRRMRRWGDGDRFLRRIADIRDREPRRRVPLELHRRLPRRDRGRPRPAAAVRRGGAARLVRLLRLLARGGHPRLHARRRGRSRR